MDKNIKESDMQKFLKDVKEGKYSEKPLLIESRFPYQLGRHWIKRIRRKP